MVSTYDSLVLVTEGIKNLYNHNNVGTISNWLRLA